MMSDPSQTQPASTDEDLLEVVDELDRPLWLAPRRRVHLDRLLHRAIAVCVFDPTGAIWLQKRSATKDTYPGHWDWACSGHVDPGESYEATARRELGEELGIDAQPSFLAKLEPAERTGWEFRALFRLHWEGSIIHHPDEIERMEKFTYESIARSAAAAEAPEEGPWPLAPGVEHFYSLMVPQPVDQPPLKGSHIR